MFSPLEQFDVVRVFNLYFNILNINLDLSLTNTLIPLMYINIFIFCYI